MYKIIKKQLWKIIIFIVVILSIFIILNNTNFSIFIIPAIVSITGVFSAVLSNTFIEDYKNSLDMELEKYKNELNKYTLVTKLQFDLEFEIYKDLYSRLSEIIEKLVHAGDYIPKGWMNRKEKYNEIYDPLKKGIENKLIEYKPFCEIEILNKVKEILHETEVYKENMYTSGFNSLDEKIEIMKTTMDNIEVELENCSNLIRKRMEIMKLVS